MLQVTYAKYQESKIGEYDKRNVTPEYIMDVITKDVAEYAARPKVLESALGR